jgi:Ca2+-binding EF-hand superfamily protein
METICLIIIIIKKDVENINFEEFKKILKKMWDNGDQVKQLQTAFEMLDTKNNGFLTVDQLKKILLNLGEKIDEEDFKELLKSVTVQPDGTINNEGTFKCFYYKLLTFIFIYI